MLKGKLPKLLVGLTGGIGSGKSLVAAQFAKLDCTVVNCDHIAHALVAPGQPALAQITQHFGKKVINDDGSLNREKLRHLIFQHPKERQWLEHLLHPMIWAKLYEQLVNAQSAYCMAEIPLLVETGWQSYVSRVLVVDCSESLQIERALSRGLEEAEIRAIMKSQATRVERMDVADDVILNESDLASLERQILQLHGLYLQLSNDYVDS